MEPEEQNSDQEIIKLKIKRRRKIVKKQQENTIE